MAQATEFDAVVVGAGFSGLYCLHKLRDELGLRVRVLEAGDGVGGTWYWNRYPGARCDSEAYYYSYSFSPELEQEWSWSERYPDHAEIRRYLDHVADRLDLRRDIRLGTRVEAARFDEAANRWDVTTEAGETLRATFLVTAVGCLSAANVPALPGLADFAGARYHTAQWPHEGVDLAGLRVGLVGTGSTGIQAAPVLAAEAAHLTVFQRTANYSVPARNRPVTEAEQRAVKADYPAIRAKTRAAPNGHPFDPSDVSALDVDPAERRRRYEAAWEAGSLRFRGTFRDILQDREANETASDFIRGKIREIVTDPTIAERLTPRDHGFATKRPPIDTGYFETFNRDDVLLVDLKAEPIRRIVPGGVETEAGTYPLDVLVFATGFDALTGPLLAMDIRGAGGRALRDAWAEGPHTYLGLQAPDFPNLFTITGPGSPSVLTNMPVAIEQHVDWIAACMAHLRETGRTRIEPRPEAAEAWGRAVEEAAAATLLPEASSSWYLGANVPGKPRVFMPYAGGMARYAEICAEVARDGYRGFALT